jgi:hypothetical protein
MDPHNNFPYLPYSLIKNLVMVEGQFAHLLEGTHIACTVLE